MAHELEGLVPLGVERPALDACLPPAILERRSGRPATQRSRHDAKGFGTLHVHCAVLGGGSPELARECEEPETKEARETAEGEEGRVLLEKSMLCGIEGGHAPSPRGNGREDVH